MKKIIILMAAMFACMSMLSVNAFAMSIQFHPEFNTYKPVGWSTFTGVPVDDANAGVTFDLTSNTSTGLFDLNSPDGQNPYWWVWVDLHNVDSELPSELVANPYNINFYLSCGGSGGWYNFSNSTNNTWSRGYNVFLVEWTTETMIGYSPADISPTGRDLYIKQRECIATVGALNGTDWVEVHFWAQNPDKEAICSTDSSVTYLQTAVTTLIDINMQIWQMLFQLFSIVLILGAIFGIPLLVFKLIRWMIEEVRGKKKVI